MSEDGQTWLGNAFAANIIGQASPDADSDTWQDFALVITNARPVEDEEAPDRLPEPAQARWPSPPIPDQRR